MPIVGLELITLTIKRSMLYGLSQPDAPDVFFFCLMIAPCFMGRGLGGHSDLMISVIVRGLALNLFYTIQPPRAVTED